LRRDKIVCTIMHMSDIIDFEWDENKAISNIEKHGVSFEQAQYIFLDAKRLIVEDNRFDYREERFIALGCIDGRIHVVVYTEKNSVIRLISARKANNREQKRYADYQIQH